MIKTIRQSIKDLLKKMGWTLVHQSVWNDIVHGIPKDYSTSHADTYNKVKTCTMSGSERVVALCSAIDYLSKNNIEGDIVECGVWKGGNMMAAIDTLIKNNNFGRKLYLYDTFEGMPTPGEFDIKTGGASGVGKSAGELYKNAGRDDFILCYSSLEEVKRNIESLNYPNDQIHYIKGLVEETIPTKIPEKIALLRLDIGLYEPVLHVLKHLYPCLTPGGVLIISDYGDWKGTRKAVDEYISTERIKILLNRIDHTGRIGVKS